MEIVNYKLELYKILFYEEDITDYILIVKPPYEENNSYQSYLKLTLIYTDKTEKHIKFYNYSEVTEELKYYELIKSTKMLFFSNWLYWGVINLETFEIEKLEYSEFGVYLEKVKNTIVIDNELIIYAYDLNGNLIDEQSIEPPNEWKYFEDYIEINCIGVDKRRLKII